MLFVDPQIVPYTVLPQLLPLLEIFRITLYAALHVAMLDNRRPGCKRQLGVAQALFPFR
ncbi:hypothetical protein PtA15_7A131 [Puccinia triticina]|uniref:Uncharacterized protein n=1 Tax=Puccinia triticina TaxID=208348 RepID=A0ABY7CRK0_9BASI|nr:uncharacterized protein PtA15_7A131 [Puccinia triticina]WAQ86405.1 hypothetical protein PtA15_7A131 [Puccinia triticina]WAR56289.1 hypothetical protein PtB15_7B135 [Puccinia triticina]